MGAVQAAAHEGPGDRTARRVQGRSLQHQGDALDQKLGAGGLVRAYGGAAAECLRLARREPLVEMVELELECPFDALGTVHAALAAHAAEKTSEAFVADGARLGLRLPATQAEPLRARLRDATRDRVRVAIPGSNP